MLRMTIHDQAQVTSLVVEGNGFLLKICEAGNVQVTSLVVEGKRVGLWVKELEEGWESVSAAGPSRALPVNLVAMTFIDFESRELLTGMQRQGDRLVSIGRLMDATVEQIRAEHGKGGTIMGLQTKEADKGKLNTFWREILLSDNALATQPSPTHKGLQRRANDTCLSQGVTDGYDPEDWPQAERDLCRAEGNRA